MDGNNLQEPGGALSAVQHYGCPFGHVGAVYAWDRLGEALVAVLRDLLVLPIGRYVDDINICNTPRPDA